MNALEIGNRYRLHMNDGGAIEGTVVSVSSMVDRAKLAGHMPEDLDPLLRTSVVLRLNLDTGSTVSLIQSDVERAEDLGPADS